MQSDPTRTLPGSLLSRLSHTPNKRTFGQVAPAYQDSALAGSSKLPRTESTLRDMSSSSDRRRPFASSGSRGRPHGHSVFSHPSTSRQKKKARPTKPTLTGPIHNEEHVNSTYSLALIQIKDEWKKNPKSMLTNYFMMNFDRKPTFVSEEGLLNGATVWRTTISVSDDIVGVGDSKEKKDSERIAALSGVLQLIQSGQAFKTKATKLPSEVVLFDGTSVNYEKAKQFVEYYYRMQRYGKPEVSFEVSPGKKSSGWDAELIAVGNSLGRGSGNSKKDAETSCYLNVTSTLVNQDHSVWEKFIEAARTGKDLGLAPKIYMQISERTDDDIRDLCFELESSELYKRRPESLAVSHHVKSDEFSTYRPVAANYLRAKSERLQQRRKGYLENPAMEKMRNTRMSLPVFSRATDILQKIGENDVTICMAATGSGKTTQIPQIILDEWIDQGRGAECNVICTQPRRLAALSVADRVAKERGEVLGKLGSIGYHVRFENKLPEDHGSVTFCTTGILLKKLQSALQQGGSKAFDYVTHVIVDEVHERDVDTDILLAALKRLLADRKARNLPIKIVLMSATIDPTLFQEYFPDDLGRPATVVDVPGRSFPVEKHFLEDIVPLLQEESSELKDRTKWVFHDEKVSRYLTREFQPPMVDLAFFKSSSPKSSSPEDELEIPYPLVALIVAHVLRTSDSGHVLVFLPGWEEIQAVQRIINDKSLFLGVDFSDTSKYQLHILHSTIPLADQQVIFDPPQEGVRRIILSTNIAETSVTIPDVVYVVDTAKIKENRYDPERRISALVSSWVGKSNLNQRAGRAGRHRSGSYYGVLSFKRAEMLATHQTVEMKRVDLSNVVMHIKALNFPNMEVEDVLRSTIEPPQADRVSAAMRNLTMVGALDHEKRLTSLGRVLLQLPLDVQVGRLVLFGSFFRCLDQAITLAAILTNRDPFLSPALKREEANQVKNSWSPSDYKSDALASLKAYNAWWSKQRRGHYVEANQFCFDNFLSKPSMLMIMKIKGHLLQSLYRAGVIDVSAGGRVDMTSEISEVPPELDANKESLPLLTALITIAMQPQFAVRTGMMTYRTQQDKVVLIHPSSVTHTKREDADDEGNVYRDKQVIAYADKRQNLSMANSGPGQTFLMGCTRVDPMAYIIFGSHEIQMTRDALECDGWLPIGGNLDTLEQVRHMKVLFESSMQRVFEGIIMSKASERSSYRRRYDTLGNGAENEADDLGDVDSKRALSSREKQELDFLARDLVRILEKAGEERLISQSRRNSRPATPLDSPRMAPRSFGFRSGTSTPNYLAHNSRPATPSRLSSRFDAPFR